MKEKSIRELLENSDKAETIEILADALETKGSKIVLIVGKPREDDGLDIHVRNIGFAYQYEALGFIEIGAETLREGGD